MMKTLTWGWEPPTFERYKRGTYRILYNPQLYERVITHRDIETGEETQETITEYKVWYEEKDLPELTLAINSGNELEAKKIVLLELIALYDVSEAVNLFSIDGNDIWLDKSMRVGLNNSISKEVEVGRENTTLWYGTLNFTIPCQSALLMLTLLEIYALECYNVTALHIAFVKNATTLEELESFDYMAGYPDKLSFGL